MFPDQEILGDGVQGLQSQQPGKRGEEPGGSMCSPFEGCHQNPLCTGSSCVIALVVRATYTGSVVAIYLPPKHFSTPSLFMRGRVPMLQHNLTVKQAAGH